MWWLIPIGVGGVAALIYNAVSGKEREARQRWEENRWEVERSIGEHQRNIEVHFAQAQYSYNFHVLVDEHYGSMKAADAAYKLLDDVRSSLDGMNKMLKEAKDQRTCLQEELQKARQQKDRALIRDTIEQLKIVHEMRKTLFDDRDKVKAQRVSFLQEVRSLNNRTRELKELIRDQCGTRGLDWFNRLEERTRRKRLSEGRYKNKAVRSL